eukprot:gene4195-4443_t
MGHLDNLDLALAAAPGAATLRGYSPQQLQELLELVAMHCLQKRLPALITYNESTARRDRPGQLSLPAGPWRDAFTQGLAALGGRLNCLKLSDPSLLSPKLIDELSGLQFLELNLHTAVDVKWQDIARLPALHSLMLVPPISPASMGQSPEHAQQVVPTLLSFSVSAKELLQGLLSAPATAARMKQLLVQQTGVWDETATSEEAKDRWMQHRVPPLCDVGIEHGLAVNTGTELLRHFTSLEALRLFPSPNSSGALWENLAPVSELKQLRELQLVGYTPINFTNGAATGEALSAALPNLRALELVIEPESDQVAALAALTQLTRIKVMLQPKTVTDAIQGHGVGLDDDLDEYQAEGSVSAADAVPAGQPSPVTGSSNVLQHQDNVMSVSTDSCHARAAAGHAPVEAASYDPAAEGAPSSSAGGAESGAAAVLQAVEPPTEGEPPVDVHPSSSEAVPALEVITPSSSGSDSDWDVGSELDHVDEGMALQHSTHESTGGSSSSSDGGGGEAGDGGAAPAANWGEADGVSDDAASEDAAAVPAEDVAAAAMAAADGDNNGAGDGDNAVNPVAVFQVLDALQDMAHGAAEGEAGNQANNPWNLPALPSDLNCLHPVGELRSLKAFELLSPMSYKAMRKAFPLLQELTLVHARPGDAPFDMWDIPGVPQALWPGGPALNLHGAGQINIQGPAAPAGPVAGPGQVAAVGAGPFGPLLQQAMHNFPNLPHGAAAVQMVQMMLGGGGGASEPGEHIAPTKLSAEDLPLGLRQLHLVNVGFKSSKVPLPCAKLQHLQIERCKAARAFRIPDLTR